MRGFRAKLIVINITKYAHINCDIYSCISWNFIKISQDQWVNDMNTTKQSTANRVHILCDAFYMDVIGRYYNIYV